MNFTRVKVNLQVPHKNSFHSTKEDFQFFTDQSKIYLLSGLPFTPYESSHVFAFILGTFFLVSLFMAVIYVGYYDDRHIPRLMAMIRNRHFLNQSDVFFARFDNADTAQVHLNEHSTTTTRNVEDDGNGSIMEEVDLHFASDQSIEDVNRAFNNPMFDANIMQTTSASRGGEVGSGNDEIVKGVGEAKL